MKIHIFLEFLERLCVCMHACVCDPVCFNQIASMFHSFVHSFIQQVFTDLHARNSWDDSAYQIVFNCYEVKIFLKTEQEVNYNSFFLSRYFSVLLRLFYVKGVVNFIQLA